MQSKASNETIWKRLYEDAVLELQPTLFVEKAKAAEKAILEPIHGPSRAVLQSTGGGI